MYNERPDFSGFLLAFLIENEYAISGEVAGVAWFDARSDLDQMLITVKKTPCKSDQETRVRLPSPH